MTSKARDIADLGSNDVLETTATGVNVTGTVTSDGFQLGAGDKLYFNADRYFTPENNVDGAEVSANGKFTVKTGATPSKSLVVGATGNVSFYEDTGTTAKMVWDSSAESLGIGTASPTYDLDILSDTAQARVQSTTGNAVFRIQSTDTGESKIYFGDDSSTAVGRIEYSHDNDSMSFTVDALERMRIDSSGNVGIGTSSPTVRLELQENTNSTDVKLRLRGFNSSSAGRSAYVAYDPDSRIMGFGEDGNELNIDASGNVGIGTYNPASKLHVRGPGNPTLTIDGSDGAYTSFLTMKAAGAGASVIRAEGGTNSLVLQTNGDNERARIDSSGTFMVNTTAPSFNPQVAIHTSKSYGLEIKANTGSTAPLFVRNANGVSGSRTQMFFMYDSTTIGSIGSTSTSTSYNTTSDERLKENIQDTTHTVDINAIQVREFDWKADGSHQRYGFIAQELETVYPEAVHSPEDADKMKSVDYSKLVPLLVKEIQQLKARIETLENK